MYINQLSDNELLEYLDKHSTDPVMLRVVRILFEKQQGLISDLLAAGMDELTWTFSSDSYNQYYPGQFISHLKNEIDYTQRELEEYEQKYQDAKDEIKQLKARTVAELITELHNDIFHVSAERDRAHQERDRAIQNERRTLEKMKVWTAISTDMSK